MAAEWICVAQSLIGSGKTLRLFAGSSSCWNKTHGYNRGVSRLRRIALSDRYFFVTCHVSRERRWLSENEFECLAEVFAARRKELGFQLTAWVFLPNHWHAVVYPAHPLTISRVVESVKVGSTLRVNRMRSDKGPLWQGRYFDRVMRTVKEYRETIEYIHGNPVKAGLVSRPEDWAWSSARDYAELGTGASGRIGIDIATFSADGRERI